MFIAQGIAQLNRQREKKGSVNCAQGVREVSGEEVDLEGVPLPRSYLRHGTKLAA
jgi:hypothetical protein